MISLLTPNAGCTFVRNIAVMSSADRLLRTRINVVPGRKCRPEETIVNREDQQGGVLPRVRAAMRPECEYGSRARRTSPVPAFIDSSASLRVHEVGAAVLLPARLSAFRAERFLLTVGNGAHAGRRNSSLH